VIGPDKTNRVFGSFLFLITGFIQGYGITDQLNSVLVRQHRTGNIIAHGAFNADTVKAYLGQCANLDLNPAMQDSNNGRTKIWRQLLTPGSGFNCQSFQQYTSTAKFIFVFARTNIWVF